MIVPNSSGKWAPRLMAPENACDSHIHIYDPRFVASRPGARLTQKATVADYRLLQGRLGTSRTVVVQPAAYGFDNAVTIDAVAQLGLAKARAVAVVPPAIGDAELREMDRGGGRGHRAIRTSERSRAPSSTTRPIAASGEAIGRIPRNAKRSPTMPRCSTSSSTGRRTSRRGGRFWWRIRRSCMGSSGGTAMRFF